MLSGTPHPGEHGFTLIEVLVSMLAGVIVTGALFAILDLSLSQSTRIRNETYATQVGRTAMTQIVDELDTACYYEDVAPVQEASTPTKLVFVDAVGKQGLLPEGYLREITLEGTTLQERAWRSLGTSSWPKFEFNTANAPTSTRQLATNVSVSPSAPAPTGLFRYFKYAESTREGESEGTNSIERSPPLQVEAATQTIGKQAADVAAVEVRFTAAGSTTTSAQLERSIEVSNLVNFSFTVPRTEAVLQDVPCA